MGFVPDSAYNYYKMKLLQKAKAALVGPLAVAKSDDIPKGSQQITRDEINALQGKAMRGKKGQPVPRETPDLTRKTTYIPEHIHGFNLHRKDIEALQLAGTVLPTAGSNASNRAVLESVEDMIFNGIDELNIKGIYADAGKSYAVTDNYEWNTTNGNPLNDVVGMMGELTEDGLYGDAEKRLILSPKAYWAAHKTMPNSSLSFISQIALLFKNGMNDILLAPATANGGATIIPEDAGVLAAFDQEVAERYVEEEINLRQYAENEDQMFPFNVVTYQSIDIHDVNGFVKLDNLIEPAA